MSYISKMFILPLCKFQVKSDGSTTDCRPPEGHGRAAHFSCPECYAPLRFNDALRASHVIPVDRCMEH